MFSPGVFDKHIKDLFDADSRLLKLSRQKFPTFSSPYFDKPNHMPISSCVPGFGGGFQNSGFQQHSLGGPNPPILGIPSPFFYLVFFLRLSCVFVCVRKLNRKEHKILRKK